METETAAEVLKVAGPHWLNRFAVEGPCGDAQFFRLSALVFDTIRNGWG